MQRDLLRGGREAMKWYLGALESETLQSGGPRSALFRS